MWISPHWLRCSLQKRSPSGKRYKKGFELKNMLKKRSFHHIKTLEYQSSTRARKAKLRKNFIRFGTGLFGFVLDAFPSKLEICSTRKRQIPRVGLWYKIIKALHAWGICAGDWDLESHGRLNYCRIGAKHWRQQFHCSITAVTDLHMPN